MGPTFAAKITPHSRSHERDLLRGYQKAVSECRYERQKDGQQVNKSKRTKEQERGREIGRQRVGYDGKGPFKGYSCCIEKIGIPGGSGNMPHLAAEDEVTVDAEFMRAGWGHARFLTQCKPEKTSPHIFP